MPNHYVGVGLLTIEMSGLSRVPNNAFDQGRNDGDDIQLKLRHLPEGFLFDEWQINEMW